MKNVDAADTLMKCPQCETWPMAIVSGDHSSPPDRIGFRCPNCHVYVVYTVGVGGRLVPAAGAGAEGFT